MRPRCLLLALATLAIAPLAACASSVTAQRYDDTISNVDRDRSVWPESDLLAECGLDTSRSYFASASSELNTDDRALLGEVGRCLTVGRLSSRSVLVTGYTDSDGTSAYNVELGLERGHAVAAELASLGVLRTRIFVRSRGQDDATGETAAGRALDRKVELALLGE